MYTLIYIYFISLLILAIYGLHRSSMLYRLWKKPYKQPELPKLKSYPSVCVQLPIFNEPEVIERLIRSVAMFEYPKPVEIQILDDSNDQTVAIIDSLVSTIDSKHSIKVLRREDRQGFKAGALAYGLEKTAAELIAIFDADFIPDKDFLLKTIPYFANQKIAFVQARWTFVNRMRNLLTRAQSILIDAHFVIEHPARFGCAFFNFNGTAGVWRKKAISSAGGWQGDTITEDLDLSYRAALAGWEAIYLRDVLCSSELPEDINAFKSQQYRWMKGSAQVFKKLIPTILKSELAFTYKLEAFFHLSANFCYQLMLISGLLSVPASIIRTSINFSVGLWLEFLLFFATLGSLMIFYYASQRIQKRKTTIFGVFSAIALGVGIGAHCACASFSGLFSSVGEFVRTPKTGASDTLSYQTGCFSWKNLLKHPKESFIFTYLFLGISYLLYSQLLLSVPFVVLILSGYTIVLYNAMQQCQTKSI